MISDVLDTKMAFHIFRLSVSDLITKALLKNQRLKAQGARKNM